MADAEHHDALLNLRVLDHDVVDALSQRLSAVLDRAERAAETLEQLVADATERHEAAAPVVDVLNQRLSLASRVLKALTQESKRVGEVIDAVSEARERQEETDERLARRFEWVESALASNREDLDARRAEAERIRTRIDEATTSFTASRESSEASLADLDARLVEVHAVHEQLDSRCTEVDSHCARLHEQVDQLRLEVEHACDHLAEGRSDAEAELESLTASIADHRAAVQRELHELAERSRTSQEATARLEQGLQDYRAEFSAAVVYLQSRKHELEQRCADFDAGLDDVSSQVAALREQLAVRSTEHESIKTDLQQQLEATTAALAARVGEARGVLEPMLSSLRDGCDDGRSILSRSRELIADLDERAGRLEASLQQRSTELDTRIDEHRALLEHVRPDELLEVAKTASAELDALREMVAASNDSVRRAADGVSELARGFERRLDAIQEEATTHVALVRDEARSVRADVQCSADALMEIMSPAIDRATAAESRAGELVERVESTLASFEQRLETLSAVPELEADLHAHREAVTEKLAALDTRTDEAMTQVRREHDDALDARTTEIRSQLDELAAEVNALDARTAEAAESRAGAHQQAIDAIRADLDSKLSALAALPELRAEIESLGERTQESFTAHKDAFRQVAHVMRVELDERLSALTALPRLEAGLQSNREALDGLERRTRDEIDTRVQARIAEVSSVMAAFQSRLETLEDAPQLEAAIESCRRETARRLEQLEQTMSEAVTTVGEVARVTARQEMEPLTQLVSGLEQRTDEVTDGQRSQLEALRSAIDRAGESMRALQTQIERRDELVGRLETDVTALRETMSDDRSPAADPQLSGRVDEHDRRLNELALQFEQAVGAASSTIDGSLQTRLDEIAGRVEALGAGAVENTAPVDDDIRAQLAEMLDEIATVRAETETTRMQLRSQIDALRHEVASVSGEVSTRLESIRGQQPAVAAAAASGEADDAELQQLRTAMGQVLDRVQERLEPAIENLQTREHDAEQAVERIESRFRELQLQVRAMLDGGVRPAGETPLPPTPQATSVDQTLELCVRGFVEAVNADSDDAARHFIETHYAPAALEATSVEDRAEVYRLIFDQTGGIRTHGTRSTPDGDLVMKGSARLNDERSSYTFSFDDDGKLLGVIVDPIED